MYIISSISPEFLHLENGLASSESDSPMEEQPDSIAGAAVEVASERRGKILVWVAMVLVTAWLLSRLS